MSLEAPPTPKTSNGKRTNDDHDDPSSSSHDDLSYCLQKSLKRMKVTSASPGELRLQRDFKHAVCCAGWVPVGSCCNAWKVATNTCWYTVKQCIEDPLHLVVHSPKWAIWLSIPRLYPHHPPILSRIECSPPLDAVFQTGPEDPQVELARKRGAVIISGYSPLMRLHEILQLIVPLLEDPLNRPFQMGHNNRIQENNTDHMFHNHRLRHWYAEADCATESRDVSHSALLTPPQDDHMEDAELFMLFPPNRFDLGYRRGETREDYSWDEDARMTR